jgi:hypothetical protein
MLSWLIGTMASVIFAMVLAFVIYGYRWMDAVKDNHLVHIQKACESSAERLIDVREAVLLHDRNESSHYEMLAQHFLKQELREK